ncbi:MAG: sugar kinase [Prevotella sp.]|nr:sugar kinase [Prevotella sp.]
MKITTFGEILLRLSKQDYRRLMQGSRLNGDFGGSEANVAVSLAMLGNDVSYVTRIPDSLIGKACRHSLQERGISLKHVVTGGKRLGTYYFEPAAAMRNSCVVYDRENSAFNELRPGMINWKEVLRGSSVFHCSGITCATSQSAAETTFEAVEEAERMGITVAFDINYRKNLWKYGAEASDVLSRLAKHADIIFGDQEEYEVISGMPRVPFTALSADDSVDNDAFRDLLASISAKYPKCKKMIMAARNQITSGHHTLTGFLFSQGKYTSTRIYDILDIVDPMGVGDAFIAAFLHAWLKWGDDDTRTLLFSLSASALKNSVPGDFNLIGEDEIRMLMDGTLQPDKIFG